MRKQKAEIRKQKWGRMLLGFLFSAFLISAFPATIIVPGPRPPIYYSTLNTGLIAYWKLGEASGTRVDSEPTGSAQDLTDNNTVTSNTGKIGNAAEFTAANSESLSRADSTDLSTGDIDYSFSVWVYLTSKAALREIICKFTGTGNQREYQLYYNQATDRFLWNVSGNGISSVNLSADNLGSPSTATWYHLVAIHDSVNNLLSITVNAGTANTVSYATGSFDSTSVFVIGASPAATFYMDGRIDEVGFWKKVLSAAEITELYNAGAGKTCCPF